MANTLPSQERDDFPFDLARAYRHGLVRRESRGT